MYDFVQKKKRFFFTCVLNIRFAHGIKKIKMVTHQKMKQKK